MDKIAVLIPCYNESATIAKVVKDYRAALPEAAIYVYDNNSTDGTDEIARAARAEGADDGNGAFGIFGKGRAREAEGQQAQGQDARESVQHGGSPYVAVIRRFIFNERPVKNTDPARRRGAVQRPGRCVRCPGQ